MGSYPIVPRHATNPNYDFHYVAGTETITPAPLTIRADDTAVKYGALDSSRAYSWTGVGWVNGDTDATLSEPGRSQPTCAASIQGSAALVGTLPGRYAGGVRCTGADDPNYAIGYARGTLTVNPVIRLDQTGLCASLPKRASIDHQSVTLPTGDVEVAYGTGHAYAFPPVLVGDRGRAYLTRLPPSSGRSAATSS